MIFITFISLRHVEDPNLPPSRYSGCDSCMLVCCGLCCGLPNWEYYTRFFSPVMRDGTTRFFAFLPPASAGIHDSFRENDRTGYTQAEPRQTWVPCLNEGRTGAADWPAPLLTLIWSKTPGVYPAVSFFSPNCTQLARPCTLTCRSARGNKTLPPDYFLRLLHAKAASSSPKNTMAYNGTTNSSSIGTVYENERE